ncbi:MAG: ABC transporter permease [Gemmatimonadota bacterium]
MRIGVAALVAIFALGDGLERFSREQIEKTTDLQTLVLRPRATEIVDGVSVRRADPATFAPADAEELAGAVGAAAGAALILAGSGHIEAAGVSANLASALAGPGGVHDSEPARRGGSGPARGSPVRDLAGPAGRPSLSDRGPSARVAGSLPRPSIRPYCGRRTDAPTRIRRMPCAV